MLKYFKPWTFFGTVIVFFLTLLVWHPVLGQALIAEGPTYLIEPYASMLDNHSLKDIASRHDVGALLFFKFFGPIFKDKMSFYMLVLLTGAGLVNVSLFLLVYKITKSFVAALLSSILLIANYIGSFEILGIGYYQWFIQRVPNFALILLSFWFLVNSYKNGKQAYLMSVLLYFLAVFLAHYSILLLPLFVLYPLSKTFIESRFGTKVNIPLKSQNVFYNFLLTVPFIIITFLLIKNQLISAEIGMGEFIRGRPQILWEILREITILTIPPDAIRAFVKLLDTRFLFEDLFVLLEVIVICAWVIFALFTLKFEKVSRPFFLSVLLSVPIIVFLVIYLNSYFVGHYESSRYLYVPSILVSVFWGIALHALSKKGTLAKFIVVGVVFWWFFYNQTTILRHFDAWQERHDRVLQTINLVREKKDSFPENAIVVLHRDNGYYGASMLERFHGQRGIKFIPESSLEGPDSLEKGKTYIFLNLKKYLFEIRKRDN